jgi:hypothetical protein
LTPSGRKISQFLKERKIEKRDEKREKKKEIREKDGWRKT